MGYKHNTFYGDLHAKLYLSEYVTLWHIICDLVTTLMQLYSYVTITYCCCHIAKTSYFLQKVVEMLGQHTGDLK